MRDTTCDKCGHIVQLSDLYCTNCGAPVIHLSEKGEPSISTDQISPNDVDQSTITKTSQQSAPIGSDKIQRALMLLRNTIVITLFVVTFSSFLLGLHNELIYNAWSVAVLFLILSVVAYIVLKQFLKHKKMTFIFFLAILSIVLAAIGFSLFRSVSDTYNYKNGNQAYQNANCTVAIDHYKNIIDAWRIGNNSKYIYLAQSEKSECELLLAASQMLQNGQESAALLAYLNFIDTFPKSVLVKSAQQQGLSLFRQGQIKNIATSETCQQISKLRQNRMISDPLIPQLLYYCGEVYSVIDYYYAYDLFITILKEYPDSPIVPDAQTALYNNSSACDQVDSLKTELRPSIRDVFLPALYFNCGQQATRDNNLMGTNYFFELLLNDYPSDANSPQAENALLANLTKDYQECDDFVFENQDNDIAKRPGFMPKLYYTCGQADEAAEYWVRAVYFYNTFLSRYPTDSLVPLVKDGLVRSLIARARSEDNIEVALPPPDGKTGDNTSQIIFQNDSPETLQIVFHGPETQLFILDACQSCLVNQSSSPSSCAALGPVGQYTLKPGKYEVLVEAISNHAIIPWMGNWNISGGYRYSSCFFVRTK